MSGAASFAAGGLPEDAGAPRLVPVAAPAAVTVESATDEDLLERARDGDREAFGVLVERHHRTLACVLRQKLGPGAPLEDLLQDVFARALTHIGRFQKRSSFLTWATSIAINLGIDWQRTRSRRRRLAPPADVDADHVPSKRSQRHLELIEERDEARRARAAVDRLPDNMRLAVTLRVMQDVPYEEIARQLGAPLPRVRQWVSRGLKQVREILGPPGGVR